MNLILVHIWALFQKRVKKSFILVNYQTNSVVIYLWYMIELLIMIIKLTLLNQVYSVYCGL